jgi:hypothetical protein
VVLLFCLPSRAFFAPAYDGTLRPRNRSRTPREPFLLLRLAAAAKEDDNDDDDDKERKNGKGPLDFLFNPYESKIPKELEGDIYEIEGNTPAAKERTGRVASYAAVCAAGVLCAFFNGFLTELRAGSSGGGVPGVDLGEAGFGWVTSNFVTSFLFTNKVGGGLCLLGGAAAGLLAEAEYDTRRINAERIYEELERRRTDRPKQKKKKPASTRKKKRRSGRETKRLGALSEVLSVSTEEPAPQSVAVSEEEAAKEEEPTETPTKEEKKEGGIMGTIKGFYEKADSLAAAQARLLNKELEDRGIVEKITDETGLKVIGREAASRLKENKTKEATSSQQQQDKPKE